MAAQRQQACGAWERYPATLQPGSATVRTGGWTPLGRVAILAAYAAAVCALAAPEGPRGITRLVAYRSGVDGSLQEYGVYVPPGEPPVGGYPVVLHAHGYGWWVGTDFSQWQKEWADRYRWVLVQLNARGPNFYWGIGDVATREVIEDLYLRFGIDRRRVFITGASMGGTGAHRQGVMNPERIAAAVGVDGWTDFREWHWHWYARKDQRDDIEEFRRPLLEAASPVYLAERARWADVWVIADGRDDVVLPWQGRDLAKRLGELGEGDPGTYVSGLTYHPDAGHGAGYDLAWIYNYFLGKIPRSESDSFCIATTVLDHGEMYWGRMERLHHQGEKAVLDCACDTEASLVHVTTTNLDAFTLYLALSPLGDAERVSVYADGIPAYTGAPVEVTLEAVRDPDDKLVGWEAAAHAPGHPSRGEGRDRLCPCSSQERLEGGETAGDASAAATAVVGCDLGSAKARRRPSYRKSHEICGPIGHAFLTPFRVCWGTAGPEEQSRRHREEAQAFAAGWNEFMVHGPGVVATSEDEVKSWEIEQQNLVVYGTLDTSKLLRRAHAARPLPVEVWSDRVVVRDPLTGDREYRGHKFGAFVVYPNPLTEGRTYLVICSGRFASRPDGSELRGLEFDLEKLCWAYPDYVVFNSDVRELPHVMNVNNKPPVTCYEAGYFVEAGYFDADWQPDRLVTLGRVRRTRPGGVRLIHVAQVQVEETRQSMPAWGNVDGEPRDPPRQPLGQPMLAASVQVVDAEGRPVRQARVTGHWVGLQSDAMSRPTLSDGVAWFPYPAQEWPRPLPRFTVLSVMATGAEHDFEADVLAGSVWEDPEAGLAVRPRPLRQRIEPALPVPITVEVANTGDAPRSVVVDFIPPNGSVVGEDTGRVLQPGEGRRVTLCWLPDATVPAGLYRGLVQASDGRGQVQRPLELLFPRPRLPVRLVAVSARDLLAAPADGQGADYEIRAQVRNLGPSRELTLRLVCSLLEARRYLPAQVLTIPPGQVGEAVWRPQPDEPPLPRGEHQARVTLLDGGDSSEVVGFAVR